jgi:hypothetical protein
MRSFTAAAALAFTMAYAENIVVDEEMPEAHCCFLYSRANFEIDQDQFDKEIDNIEANKKERANLCMGEVNGDYVVTAYSFTFKNEMQN